MSNDDLQRLYELYKKKQSQLNEILFAMLCHRDNSPKIIPDLSIGNPVHEIYPPKLEPVKQMHPPKGGIWISDIKHYIICRK